jgi:hypothetical protein
MKLEIWPQQPHPLAGRLPRNTGDPHIAIVSSFYFGGKQSLSSGTRGDDRCHLIGELAILQWAREGGQKAKFIR